MQKSPFGRDTPLSDLLCEPADQEEGYEGGKIEPWRFDGWTSTTHAFQRTTHPYVEWLSSDLNFEVLALDKASWLKFWFYEVQLSRMPRFWLRWAFGFYQSFYKVTSGTPGDAQLATYLLEAAIHTAPKDRSRAIDRYARAARPAPESDELLVLEAMQRARFSIISIVRRHPIAGLIVKDLFRGVEVWLVDEGLESSLPDGAALATRLFTPEGFAMTAGVLVPLDSELIENAVANTPQLLRKRPDEVIDDRRVAEAIYHAALARGIMQQVAYQDGIANLGDLGASAALQHHATAFVSVGS